jgi:hypothetical protein
MVDTTVINGGTVVLVHIASTVGEVRKAGNDWSTKLIITLVIHLHKKCASVGEEQEKAILRNMSENYVLTFNQWLCYI